MRRPTQHHRIPTTQPAWMHPYTGVTALGVFYNDGGTPPAGDSNPQDPPKPSPPATPRTFTQDELTALAAKEKAQGERAGARAALEKVAADLGFTNLEDAKAFIEEGRRAKEAQLTEQEKRERELADREARADAREKAAADRERAATRRAILVGLGATGVDLEDAVALLRVPDDADDTAITEAAEALKGRRGELFGVARPSDPAAVSGLPPAPGGAPAGGPPARQTPTGKPGDRGREMARLRGHKPAA
ncbi:hypothetical protein [Streptomyces sp. rh34]|uniref:hypothetical protein n=1 Tax=Streptomyces sp. rh34 TaxID=2034272 RepID=UPI000BEF8864|nr:hypothetical protein [Streptomyces sp. rh34]